MSSRAQFRVRLGATRRGGSGESIQGLRAAVRAIARASQPVGWTAQGRRAAGGATARDKRKGGRGDLAHHMKARW
jgi:hypothetical protein